MYGSFLFALNQLAPLTDAIMKSENIVISLMIVVVWCKHN